MTSIVRVKFVRVRYENGHGGVVCESGWVRDIDYHDSIVRVIWYDPDRSDDSTITDYTISHVVMVDHETSWIETACGNEPPSLREVTP